ncbi:hypothetical protein DSO57_1026022 [Entomophthora muscae]|uniref:Uncharacterized protein n=1 Tax=Entomophthora muscae TaxID=34485 RepID=A0ACC2TQ08_9FUNG|nr:hypothetical protein DSO57_1026022 [Entomophthora muscae]
MLALNLLPSVINQPFIDKPGKSPLHIAIKRGNLSLAFELIDGGVELNCIDAAGKTPLHYARVAIAANNYDLVVKLLEKGASADKCTTIPLVRDAFAIAPSPFQFARSHLAYLRNSTCSFDWTSIFEMIRILRALKEHIHSQNVKTTQIDDLCDQLQSSLSILPYNSALVPVNVAYNADAEHGLRTNHALDTVDKICNLFDHLDI